jgi:hypothetical protein
MIFYMKFGRGKLGGVEFLGGGYLLVYTRKHYCLLHWPARLKTFTNGSHWFSGWRDKP